MRTSPLRGGTPVQLPFSYDDAGNMDSKALTADSSLVFTHDAWNRLVQVGRVTGTGNPIPVASYHYNGLHQRIIKRVDTSAPGTGSSGTLDQQHQFYYTAGWQIAEELVDENWSEMGPASIDKTFKYVWGVRYIDDIILRRREAEMFGAGEETWYHLTDHQFSTVALIDNSANLVERVTYDAYGAARHHWAGDINGDGAVARNDQDMMSASQNKSIGDAEYNVDADITRTGTVDMTDADWTTTPNFKAALPKGVLSASIVGNSIGYAGYVFNAEVPGGLYTVRFRHYDPGLGRWLERDPLGYVDSMSLYRYGWGNPTAGMDPFGLAWWNPWSWGKEDAEWEEMMRRNQELLRRKLEEQRDSGIISDEDYLRAVWSMTNDLDTVLLQLEIIRAEGRVLALETGRDILLTLIPVEGGVVLLLHLRRPVVIGERMLRVRVAAQIVRGAYYHARVSHILVRAGLDWEKYQRVHISLNVAWAWWQRLNRRTIVDIGIARNQSTRRRYYAAEQRVFGKCLQP